MTFDDALAQKVLAKDIIQACMMWNTYNSSIEDRIQNERTLQEAYRSQTKAEDFLSEWVRAPSITHPPASDPEAPSAS